MCHSVMHACDTTEANSISHVHLHGKKGRKEKGKARNRKLVVKKEKNRKSF